MTGISRLTTIATVPVVLFILVLLAFSSAFAANPKPAKAGKKSDDLDKQIEELDTEGGHAEYRDFVLAQVLRGKRPTAE